MTSAAELAREHFGLDAQPSPLPGELDRNYALGDHVLKLHAAGSDAGLLDLQDAAMEHVAARSLAVATPRLVRARDGAPRVAVDGGFARVLTWVPGTPWGLQQGHDAAALASLGRAVAELDAALADFEHPRLDRPLRWDMLRAGDLRGRGGRGRRGARPLRAARPAGAARAARAGDPQRRERAQRARRRGRPRHAA